MNELTCWLPPMSEDARLMQKAVEANPHDATLWLIYADALQECESPFLEALARLAAAELNMMNSLIAGMGIPAHLLEGTGKA